MADNIKMTFVMDNTELYREVISEFGNEVLASLAESLDQTLYLEEPRVVSYSDTSKFTKIEAPVTIVNDPNADGVEEFRVYVRYEGRRCPLEEYMMNEE